ncbi:MAG: hypothetical protein ACKPCP_36085 [Sphaerospermopsis kisseleviana]
MNIIAAIRHQIKATLNLIASGSKQYILQLLDLEQKLEALTTPAPAPTPAAKPTPEILINQLTGSPKQIKWAKDIITRCYWNHPRWDLLTKHLNKHQAGWWIENRSILADGNIPLPKLSKTQYYALRFMSEFR